MFKPKEESLGTNQNVEPQSKKFSGKIGKMNRKLECSAEKTK